MKTYKKSPLPPSLKSVPKGYVYLGKGGEFKTLEEGFRGYALYKEEKFNDGLLCDNQSWSGNGPNTYYFAPADSEIARLNGIKPRTRKVAPKPVAPPAPKITPLPDSVKTPDGFVYLGMAGEFKRPDDKGFHGDCANPSMGIKPNDGGAESYVCGTENGWYYFAKIDSPVAILNGHKPAPAPKATIADLWDAFTAYTKSGHDFHSLHVYDDESGWIKRNVNETVFDFGNQNGGFTGAVAWLKANTK